MSRPLRYALCAPPVIRAVGRATRRYGLAPVTAFGAEAEVALIRKGGRLEGAELWFRDGGAQVSEAIAHEFDIEDLDGQEPY